MVNALYDFNGVLPAVPALTPYVGVGVGMVWNDVKSLGPYNGTASSFGYQAIIGAAYSLSSMAPGLSLTAEGRYLGSLDVTHIIPEAPASFQRNNHNVSALIGLRYAFGAPAPMAAAPAPAPAAAPGVARTYLVFFDWDRADLTARAREIIKEAATNAQRGNVTRIEVAGHADRSGDAGYNQRLSQRRAEAVAAQLVRDGVARNAIAVAAFGESRPLVPTADGVREPQNRRVEIVLK